MLSRLAGKVQSWFGGGQGPFEERRRVIRLPRRLPVDCFRNQPFKAAVVDIGVGGVLIECSERLKVGQEVLVRSSLHPASDFIKCRVQWVRLNRGDRQVAGLKFVDEGDKLRASWVKAVLTQAGFTPEFYRQRRRLFRVPAKLLSQAKTLEGDFVMKVMVRDLSMGGATFLAFTRLPAGTTLFLSIGAVPDLSPVEITCYVLATRYDPARNQTRYNVQFLNLDARRTRFLRKVLLFLMKRAASRPEEEPEE